MSENLSALLYLVASVCFIMALRGLSSPDTARGGNFYGIAGMVIAVVTTLAAPEVVSYWLIILGILIGGAIGAYIALRIQMTALPQLVAAFHSLVGLAAVCVATAGAYATYTTMVPYMRRWASIYSPRKWLQDRLPDWFYGTVGRVAIRAGRNRPTIRDHGRSTGITRSATVSARGWVRRRGTR